VNDSDAANEVNPTDSDFLVKDLVRITQGPAVNDTASNFIDSTTVPDPIIGEL
jgi:hypothetical protein